MSNNKHNIYLSINPYTLDSGFWTCDELRDLCKTLDLSSKGSKKELIERYN